MTALAPGKLDIAGVSHEWDLVRGELRIGGLPSVTMFRDSSLARLMSAFLAMVGPRRFALALQAEGVRSTDGDWRVISGFSSFEQGFVELAKYAAVSGWGGWELVDLDRAAKVAVFRVTNGWESVLPREGSAFNGGLIAGKLTGLCQRLFETTCWPRQTAFTSDGDAYDEFVIEASNRSLDDEMRELAADDQATAADLQQMLATVHASAAAREAALAERDRMVAELQEKIDVIAEQRQAILTLSTPIIELWDEVVAVPLVGTIDASRAAQVMERLLEAILQRRARCAILDLTGVETIDTATADNFLCIVRAVKLLGAQGMIAGIGPHVAQTLVGLGVDLTAIPTFSNLREALKAYIVAPRRAAPPTATMSNVKELSR